MSTTPCLDLPYLAAGQAQKHVTLNESLRILDALVQIGVETRSLATPPINADEGDRYLIPIASTGVWSDRSDEIAAWQDGAWQYFIPKTGWLAYISDESVLLAYTGSGWSPASSLPVTMARLGINATPDDTNKLSVASEASLFSHNGAGHQLKVNKANAGDTASLLFQSGYSGRAEMGCPGSDAFAIKVSADGNGWKTAMETEPASGAIRFPQGVVAGDRFAHRNLIRNASFRINQRGVSGTISLGAGAYGHDGVKAGADGCTYTADAVGRDTQLTISAGSLILPVEASLVGDGVHVASHAGTAQLRIWQGVGHTGSGTYATAPLASPALAGNLQTNVEFTLGTVLRPQLEAGLVITGFERLPDQTCLMQSLYYFSTESAVVRPVGIVSSSSTTRDFILQFPAPMRAVPTIAISWSGGSSGGLYAQSRFGSSAWRDVGSTTAALYLTGYTASAEI